MSMTESGASEARQQIERWIEESQLLLGRTIPSVLEDNQRLRDKTFAAEEDCDRMREEIAGLRRELGALQSELEALRDQHEYLRGERASVGESLTRAVHHMSQMMQPINEMVAKLNVTQPLAIEEGAYR
jgi:chromosome segregation ATPase